MNARLERLIQLAEKNGFSVEQFNWFEDGGDPTHCWITTPSGEIGLVSYINASVGAVLVPERIEYQEMQRGPGITKRRITEKKVKEILGG